MWGRLATCAAVGYRRRSTAKAAGADCQSAAGYQPAPQNLVRQPTPAQFFSGISRAEGPFKQGRKTNVGQVGNLRGGWLPPPVHREGGRGRLPIGRRLPTCPTKSRPPTDARSVFQWD